MSARDNIKPARRRWWQLLCRGLAAAALLAGALYVTLPWWLPTGIVGRYLAEDMSRQMGVDVHIGEVSVSWSDGLLIRDLRIHNDESFGGGVMVSVEEVRGDFSPLDMVFRNRFDRMVLDRPRMDVLVDEAGNVSIAPLRKLHFEVVPDRVSVRQGVATLAVPKSDHVLQFDVADLRVEGGRIEEISRVTMSAHVWQEGPDAPVSLQMSRAVTTSTAASASMNISNLDLSQLGLPEMLGLPLRELAGRCSGSIDLQLNPDGVVDRCSVDFEFSDLSIQPREGPDLPVVRSAGVGLSVRLDPLREILDIESARVDMPGLELTGRGRMTTTAGGICWDAVESLDFTARMHPDRLTAMLGRELPGGFDVSGPVHVSAKLHHRGVHVPLAVLLDATEADISRHGAPVKPAGRRLRAELSGLLNDRTFSFRSDTLELALGDNTLSGSVAVDDVRRLPPAEGDPLTPADLLGRLRQVTWRCRWTIADLSAIASFWPELSITEQVSLEGAVTGQFLLEPGREQHVSMSVKVPEDASLGVAGRYAKPAGEDISLTYKGWLESDAARLTDGSLTLAVGGGRLVKSDVVVDLGKAHQNPGHISLGGQFYAAEVEQLLSGWKLPDEPRLSGTVSGRYDLNMHTDGMSGSLFADMSGLSAGWGSHVTKPADEACSLSLRASLDESGGGSVWRADGELRLAWASLSLEAAGDAYTGKAEMSVSTWGAERLVEWAPALRSALGEDRLGGHAGADVQVGWQAGRVQVDLAVDADDIEYIGVGRQKSSGTPAKLDLAASAVPDDDGAWEATMDRCRVRFGDGHAELTGRVRLNGRPTGGSEPFSIDDIDFDTRLETSIALDRPLLEMLPEFGRFAERNELEGTFDLSANLRTADGMLHFDVRADATDLSATRGGVIGEELPAPLAFTGLSAGPAVKPRGLAAEVRFAGRAARDMSGVELRQVTGNVGDVRFSAKADLAADGHNGYVLTRAKADVAAERAATVYELLPSLEPWNLEGSAGVRLEYTGGEDGRIDLLALKLDRLTAHIAGKDVLLDGELRLAGLGDPANPELAVRAVSSEGLEIRIGENHAWVLLDVAGLDTRPAGRVELLCEYLDDLDLMQWVSPSEDRPRPEGKLTEDEKARLRHEADEWIRLVQRHLERSELELRARAKRVRTFDPQVEEYYEVNNLRTEGSVLDGTVSVKLVAGLHGGTYRRKLETNLGEESPTISSMTEMVDVMATESIQPQLAMYFPGNTVHGEFNRVEDVSFPLGDMLAQTLDPRYPIHPVGRAKTVTIDGVVVGRAAPKFVTRVFPGLNLTSYEYQRMTSFAEFLPDGTAVNDMIFNGQLYDMYVEGTTDADNIGEYEIGLILLSTPQSPEWNHKYRQGRIPLMHFHARIEGGEMHDTRVWYFWPNETLFTVFLKNNIFYRLWLERRRDEDDELPQIQ